MICAATLALIAYIAGNVLYSHYLLIDHVPFAGELMVVCGALIGAGVGFLWFNAPPAQIFMGEPGRSRSAGCSARRLWRSSTRSCWPWSAGCS